MKTSFEIREVMQFLPHRYPFLLVDRIVDQELGKSIVGLKNVTYNEAFFVGHFPELPTMPGVLILEELEHARKRKASIHGEVVGYGSTADAYRLTDMDPEGRGAARAMEIAMEKACVGPQNIDYINAHGTSTAVNDSLETFVIKKVMGDYAAKVPVSSTKSMLGHMIAAAGGVEAIICLMAMRDSMIPPTINFEEPDPECDLDYVPNTARRSDVKLALSNSFGFGGQNICLALRRYDGT